MVEVMIRRTVQGEDRSTFSAIVFEMDKPASKIRGPC